jgi:hypothetical protein
MGLGVWIIVGGSLNSRTVLFVFTVFFFLFWAPCLSIRFCKAVLSWNAKLVDLEAVRDTKATGQEDKTPYNCVCTA